MKNKFELYLELTQNCLESCAVWIQLRLKDNFAYTTADEDCAALLLEAPAWFSLSKSRVGSFDSSKLGLHFSIYDNGDSRMHDYVLGIGYTPANIEAPSITALADKLYELNLIHKKREEQ